MNKKTIITLIFIFLFLVAIVLTTIDFLALTENFSKLSGYFCNIATECLGLILTICIIQNIFDKFESKKEREEENRKILEYNKLISVYISYYKRAFYCIITPIEKRDFNNISLPLEIKLCNLKDLHRTTLLVTDSINKSSIKSYYEYEVLLKNAFKTLIDSMNFKYNKDLRKILLDFIMLTSISDVSSAILDHKNHSEVLKLMEKMLESDNLEDMYKQYKNNELQSNLIMPYFMLYDSLDDKQNIIIEYEKEIELLK